MDNKKLIRNIIISVVVIAVLAGLLVWVNSIPDKTEDNSNANVSETEEIEVLSLDKENAKSVKIENASETYTIVKNGDEYTVLEKPNIIYSSSKLKFCFEDFMSIKAAKDVTDDKIDFEKSSQATITMNDGTQHIVTVGNKVIGGNERFVRCNDKIYSVLEYQLSYFDALSNSFRDTNLGSIKSSLESMKIYENGNELVSFRKASEDDANNFPVSVSYVMTYPKYLSVSEDRIRSLFDTLGEGYSLDIQSFADDNIANASNYGIGKKTVVINDGENEFKLAYGNKDEKGNIYVVVNDGGSIYTMSSTLFDIIDKYNGDVIMNKLTHIVNLDDIKNIVFEGDGNKYTLERKGKEGNYTYDINGKSVSEDSFKAIYREIIGITSDKIAYNGVAGKAEYTVTVNFPDGKSDKWEYIAESERNYVLLKNGEAQYICLKKNVEAAMANIKKELSK